MTRIPFYNREGHYYHRGHDSPCPANLSAIAESKSATGGYVELDWAQMTALVYCEALTRDTIVFPPREISHALLAHYEQLNIDTEIET